MNIIDFIPPPFPPLHFLKLNLIIILQWCCFDDNDEEEKDGKEGDRIMSRGERPPSIDNSPILCEGSQSKLISYVREQEHYELITPKVYNPIPPLQLFY